MRASIKEFVIAFAIAGLATSPVKAQREEGCFMTDSNGRVMSLGRLCGENPNSKMTETFRIPIERRDRGTPVIKVRFNGTQTYEMLVDTGASHTVITPAMAKQLGLTPVGVAVADTASDTGVEFPLALVASVRAGSVAATDLLVAISPALNIGLLGQDFYGNRDVIIRENYIEFHSR
ncbi:retropepsin-like aspartic protease [Oscillatoria sp. FACHB-1406]|uniref:retropepsin-like aspartic protease family protein n=1 Tax=Oscillatoria sp. FACHB-1406 TaxID=2692846 RepID=UPI001684043A|nr:retropepsin-like aspartic protease [Oscillatoria sp. FACHB-1406]MBD2576220.1 retroviral-like aspartic protease family protein [Oscillatoria sp. FACHB-1406]